MIQIKKSSWQKNTETFFTTRKNALKNKKKAGPSDGKTEKAISQGPMLLDFVSQNLGATLGPSFSFSLRPAV